MQRNRMRLQTPTWYSLFSCCCRCWCCFCRYYCVYAVPVATVFLLVDGGTTQNWFRNNKQYFHFAVTQPVGWVPCIHIAILLEFNILLETRLDGSKLLLNIFSCLLTPNDNGMKIFAKLSRCRLILVFLKKTNKKNKLIEKLC